MSQQQFADQFGQLVTAEYSATVLAWNEAISNYFFFRGNPVDSALSLAGDKAFVMGDVFCASMMGFEGAAENDA